MKPQSRCRDAPHAVKRYTYVPIERPGSIWVLPAAHLILFSTEVLKSNFQHYGEMKSRDGKSRREKSRREKSQKKEELVPHPSAQVTSSKHIEHHCFQWASVLQVRYFLVFSDRFEHFTDAASAQRGGEGGLPILLSWWYGVEIWLEVQGMACGVAGLVNAMDVRAVRACKPRPARSKCWDSIRFRLRKLLHFPLTDQMLHQTMLCIVLRGVVGLTKGMDLVRDGPSAKLLLRWWKKLSSLNFTTAACASSVFRNQYLTLCKDNFGWSQDVWKFWIDILHHSAGTTLCHCKIQCQAVAIFVVQVWKFACPLVRRDSPRGLVEQNENNSPHGLVPPKM